MEDKDPHHLNKFSCDWTPACCLGHGCQLKHRLPLLQTQAASLQAAALLRHFSAGGIALGGLLCAAGARS